MPTARLLHTATADAGGHALISLLTGDVRAVLPTLASNSVQCCITSPPYYALRSYLDASHPDKHREMGSESTPDAYIAAMVEVFRQIRRVLRDDGTCWVNMGDSYNANQGAGFDTNQNGGARKAAAASPRVYSGLAPKQLLMMPARLALALQADGWWLRSDIIWAKPNPMPESVTDRCTSAHEHIFMLTKKPRYYFDSDAIREPYNEASLGRYGYKFQGSTSPGRHQPDNSDERYKQSRDGEPNAAGRSCRNVWWIATAPFPAAHFATFPPELAERCIRAGTSERGACAACGAPWVRQTDTSYIKNPSTWGKSSAGRVSDTGSNGWDGNAYPNLCKQIATIGWSPSCQCNAETRPCVVLDPFSGAGTALLVADRLGRDSVGIDLNHAYVEMARERLQRDCPLFAEMNDAPIPEPPENERMADLFAEAAE